MHPSSNPFPGLKNYDEKHSSNFNNRAHEIEDLLQKLREYGIAILSGSNGSGKTSLLRAGIIPKLRNGFQGKSGKNWRICEFRTFGNPIEQMAFAMAEQGLLYKDHRGRPEDYSRYVSVLNQKKELSLIDLYINSEISQVEENLIFIIEQVEDLYRFNLLNVNSQTESDEEFFDIIYRTNRQKNIPIYFIISIQNIFLNHLNNYKNFVTLLSKSLYNLPSLKAKQFETLTTEIFADQNIQLTKNTIIYFETFLKERPNTLPLIQYILNRIHHKYSLNPVSEVLFVDIEDPDFEFHNIFKYIHSELGAFFDNLNKNDQYTFELIIRSLFVLNSEISEQYYQRFKYIREYTGLPDRATAIINEFQNKFGSILEIIEPFKKISSSDLILNDSDVISLKYDLFASWDKSKEWFDSELEYYKHYNELQLKSKKQDEFLEFISLQRAVEWKNNRLINFNWSLKYNFDFFQTIKYIDASNNAHLYKLNQEKKSKELIAEKERNIKRFMFAFGILISIFFYWLKHSEAQKLKLDNIKLEALRKQDSILKLKYELEKNNLQKLIKSDSILKLNYELEKNNLQKLIKSDSILKLKYELEKNNLKAIRKKDSTKILKDEANSSTASSLKKKISKNSGNEINPIISKSLNNLNRPLNQNQVPLISKIKNNIKVLITKLNAENNYGNEKKILELTKTGIELYDQFKKESLALKLSFDTEEARDLGTQLTSALQNLYPNSFQSSLNFIPNSYQSKSQNIVTSSQNNNLAWSINKKLFLYEGNAESQKLKHEIALKTQVEFIEFIGSDLLAVGTVKQDIWIINLVSNKKIKILSSNDLQKRLGGSKVFSGDRTRLKSKELLKMIYIEEKKSLLLIYDNFFVDIKLKKVRDLDSNYYDIIFPSDLSTSERFKKVTYSKKQNALILTTNTNKIFVIEPLKLQPLKALKELLPSLAELRLISLTDFREKKILLVNTVNNISLYSLSKNSYAQFEGELKIDKFKIKDFIINNNKIYILDDNGSLHLTYMNKSMKNQKVFLTPPMTVDNSKSYVSIKFFSTASDNDLLLVKKNGNIIVKNFDIDHTFSQIKIVYSKRKLN